VDAKGWVAREEMAGAWIKLTWDRPVLVTEMALYDRPNRVDNVLSGTLTFDDGASVAVPALPTAGSRLIIPDKPHGRNLHLTVGASGQRRRRILGEIRHE
jgi:hypothetical protein